jgi:archaetidylinositol phosphate synthase
MTTEHQDAPREANFLLARPERAVLTWLAKRMPARVQPDHLTVLALLAAIGIAAAYLASNRDPAWLWVASAFLVVHWFGDSLDGSLARFRKIERPRYGFYIDHLADAFATAMIGLGLGLSPYMLLSVGLVIVIGYLMLSINVYLETHVFNRFELGYGLIGPTEARLALIFLNVLLAVGVGLNFTIEGLGLTVLDVVGLVGAGVMGTMLAARAVKNLRELAIAEPSARVRGLEVE